MKKVFVCLLVLMLTVTAQAEVLMVHQQTVFHVEKKSVEELEEAMAPQFIAVRLGDQLYVFRDGVDVMSDGISADSIPLE